MLRRKKGFDVYDSKGRKVKKKHPKLRIFLVVLLALILIQIPLIGFYTDWLWFRELDYVSVFFTKLKTEILIGALVFVIALFLIKVYLGHLQKSYFRDISSHEIPDLRKLSRMTWTIAVISALTVAVLAGVTMWQQMLFFTNSTDFGTEDPIFGLDVSFYVFRLDFLKQLNSLALFLIVAVVLITLLYYVVLLSVRTPDVYEESDPQDYGIHIADEEEASGNASSQESKRQGRRGLEDLFESRGIHFEFPHRERKFNTGNTEQIFRIASGKLTVLGILFYLMFFVNFFLMQFDLLHSHTGVVYGAGFTDVNIRLNIYRVIMILSLIAAIALVLHMKKKQYRKLLRAPIAMVVIYAVGMIAAFGVQALIVSPDEIDKEEKYIENNIAFTSMAYDLEDVTVDRFEANTSLDAAAIRENSDTISNIRINDYEPVKDYYNQTQSIRQYYDFNDVDIDRYVLNGRETQTYLAPREINESKISSSWINQHLKYTHGYGVAVSRVNAVTASGQPDVLVKNIPPETSVDELKITRPEIYFGELTNNYIIVNTDEQEFDYPDGSENKYSKYEGTAGIKLNLINRVLFSIREHSIKLLVSGNVNSDSRIVINRNIKDRVEKILPTLLYDKDPYMTIADGRLYWIIDAYTTSSNYPYSEPYSGDVGSTNYIRNPIKVVVDAYNGDVDYYIVDEDDPIAQTYAKIYPKLFKGSDEVPEELKSHFRYPSYLLNIQAGIYTKYHMEEPKVFYQNEDLWDISNQIYGTEEKKMEPTYYVLSLPGSSDSEFINMIPFTPRSKQNMTAIMMARNDGENYGELVVYNFPKNKTVYGPMQIEAQIDQNTEISKEFSLWNSAGTKYRRGDMFVIPINDSIMYVEPVYLEASNQAIPEMKRVIVAYGDQIAYASGLDAALEQIFGEGSSNTQTSSSSTSSSESSEKASLSELAALANEAYENAVNAQKDGDWAGYGKYLKELEKYLGQMDSSN